MTLTEFGALVGLATGIFTLVDRCMRGRPIVILSRSSADRAEGRDIRCINASRTDIVITRIRTTSALVGVARDYSVEGISGSLVDQPFAKILCPNEGATFPVVVRDARFLENSSPATRFAIIVSWRKTSSMWLPQLPKVILSGNVRSFV
jgi:hypothetical protein